MFNTYLTQPIYNGFIFLIGVMPGGDVGFAIIAMTILVRIVFYPMFTSSIRTQMGMQAIQGDIDDINQKYKDNKEEKAKKTMELFKLNNIRPLSAILALAVQIPVFIALYFAFFNKGLPNIATDQLYSFVQTPATVNLNFLGMIDLLAPYNILLAVIVAALQYWVALLSMSRIVYKPKKPLAPEKEMAQKMQKHLMLYFLPVLIGGISYTLPAAVGLYFAAGNVISLGQEWIIKKQMAKAKV